MWIKMTASAHFNFLSVLLNKYIHIDYNDQISIL